MKNLLFIPVLLLFAGLVHAEYFVIQDYTVEVFLKENSVIEIKENIKVKYTQPRHGIFREIPYKYKVYASDNLPENFSGVTGNLDTYSLNIFDINVDKYNYKVFKKNRNVNIRIGSADKYVSGVKNYTISYKVSGGILNFDDHQEFYWNLIGTQWPVTIKNADFAVFFPKNIKLKNNEHFVIRGSHGEKNELSSYSVNDKNINGNITKPLPAGNGLTIGIKFPKGYFSSPGLWTSLIFYIKNNVFLLIPLIVFLLLFPIWYFIGRDKKIIHFVNYKLPKNITPPEAGFIINDKGDNRDLVSLIFYWAAKGHLSIEEIEDEGFFSSKDYILTKEKDLPADAKSFERTIFYGLFSGGTTSVRISSLKDTFYTYMKDAKEELRSEVTKNNIYEGYSRQIGRFLKSASIFVLFGGLFFGITRSQADIIIGGVISSLIVFIFGYIMPKKSDKGLQQYQKVKGFKDFVEMVEEPKLKVLLKKDPSYFDKTLPYAVAFGLTTKWVKKFDNILTEAPGWYSNRTMENFSFVYLASSIENSTNSMGKTMTSQPKSTGSGGFGSGGGFSGGGFGGGGGGSW